MDSPLVSIIVPVYNTEEYLAECLDSITQQKYRNLDIILVDDGSTDRCPEICDYYAKNDSRIHIIHQHNKGVSGALNTGLTAVKGAYITFSGSDDTIDPDHISNMVQLLDSKHDIACSPIKRDLPKQCEEVLSGEDALKKVIYKGHDDYMWYLVNKLFRNTLVEHVTFMPDEHYGEDFSFIWKTFLKAKTVAFGTIKTYNYRQSSTSVSLASFNEKHLSYLTVGNRFYEHIKEHRPKLMQEAEYVQARVLYRLLNIMLQGGSDKATYKYYAKLLKENQASVFKNKEVPLLFKAKLFLKIYFDRLYYYIWLVVSHFERK